MSTLDAWAISRRQGPQLKGPGHGFAGYGYNSRGVFIDTWGMFGTLTYRAVAEAGAASAGGNVFCALSPDWFNRPTGLAPSGFNANALGASIWKRTGKGR